MHARWCATPLMMDVSRHRPKYDPNAYAFGTKLATTSTYRSIDESSTPTLSARRRRSTNWRALTGNDRMRATSPSGFITRTNARAPTPKMVANCGGSRARLRSLQPVDPVGTVRLLADL